MPIVRNASCYLSRGTCSQERLEEILPTRVVPGFNQPHHELPDFNTVISEDQNIPEEGDFCPTCLREWDDPEYPFDECDEDIPDGTLNSSDFEQEYHRQQMSRMSLDEKEHYSALQRDVNPTPSVLPAGWVPVLPPPLTGYTPLGSSNEKESKQN